jgi:hypothetical protein
LLAASGSGSSGSAAFEMEDDVLAPDLAVDLSEGLAALAAGAAERAVRLLLGVGSDPSASVMAGAGHADSGGSASGPSDSGQPRPIGSGLLPEGDDVLVGALAALAAWTPDSPERRRLAEAVIAAADRTTVISAALLQAAVAGSVVPELSVLLTTIATGSASAVDQARAELIRVGPGSGAAMAAGAVQQFRWLSRTVRRAA